MMGVTGTGKTTIGRLLASRAGWHYAEGDDYHSEANKAKMHAGIPLTDEDRGAVACGRCMRCCLAGTRVARAACLPARRSSRVIGILLGEGLAANAFRFVWLKVSREILAERLSHREGHYMNPRIAGQPIGDAGTAAGRAGRLGRGNAGRDGRPDPEAAPFVSALLRPSAPRPGCKQFLRHPRPMDVMQPSKALCVSCIPPGAVACLFSSFAQTTTTPAQSPAAGGQSSAAASQVPGSQAPATTLSVNVKVVTLPVTVRDKHNQIVKGLTPKRTSRSPKILIRRRSNTSTWIRIFR